MRKLILLGWLLLNLATQAQRIANPKPFAATITANDLKNHLYTIAGKDMEGRLTASEGQRKAAAYIENEFSSLGLKPGNAGSYQLPFRVYQDSLTKASLEVNGKEYLLHKDFAVNLNNYPARLMGGEVVFVGGGIVDSSRDDYKDVNVAGKIVLVLPSTLPRQQRGTNFFALPELAQRKGAVAVLILQSITKRPVKGPQYVNGFR